MGNPKSHVQNLDTNLVREPVTTTARETDENTARETDEKAEVEAACLAACGEGLTPTARATITATRLVIDAWLASGYDLAADILPTLAERTRRQRADPIRTWAYFTTAIAKRHAQRVAMAAKSKSAGETKQTPILTERDLLVQTAKWINSGGYIPPSAVTTSKRAALLAAGLVTEATLRARQIY